MPSLIEQPQGGLKMYLMDELKQVARIERVWIPAVAEEYLAALLADGDSRLRNAEQRLARHPHGMRETLRYLKTFADYIVYSGIFWHNPLLRRWWGKAQECYDGAYDIARRHLNLPEAHVFVFAVLADDLPKYVPAIEGLRDSIFRKRRVAKAG
ncbi:MAG: hypothetical protein QW548_01505 [Candidatus Aenigmatarchaeota archaeon]